MSAAAFPSDKGTYILILHLPTAAPLTIGKLGRFDFAAGWYGYVGSAFGPGGLRGRLKHHLSPVKRPHWHIDYLRAAAPVRAVWYLAGEAADEHTWANELRSLPGAAIPVPRFGASDCKCDAHLAYFSGEVSFDLFRERAGAACQLWNPT